MYRQWRTLLWWIFAVVCSPALSELVLSPKYLQELNSTIHQFRTRSLNGSSTFVIATAVNEGFLHHLYNFDCFMRRLNLSYVVFSLDNSSHSILTNATNIQQFHSVYLRIPGETDASLTASEFRTLDFNIITARKTVAVLSLLRLETDVLFLDADVALLRDPRPYIFWDNVHYVHSLNYPCDSVDQHWEYFYNRRVEGNTGFYFVRSVSQTISLWEEVYVWMKRSFRIDDQTYFWRILRGLEHRALPLGQCRHLTLDVLHHNISLCMLNSCLFSSAMLSSPQYHERLFVNLASMNETPVSIHANFIKSKEKKVKALQSYHLWLFDGTAENGVHKCKSFEMESFVKQSIAKR